MASAGGPEGSAHPLERSLFHFALSNRRAELLDPSDGIFEFAIARRVAEPHVPAEPEGAAVDEGHAGLLEQRQDKILVGLEPRAGLAALAQQSPDRRKDIERPFRCQAVHARIGCQALYHQIAPLLELGPPAAQ